MALFSPLVTASIAAAVLLNASTATAQSISIPSPSELLVGMSDVVPFTGSVSGLPIGQENDYDAYVQGVQATRTVTGAGTFSYIAQVPVGPLAPTGGFPPEEPYVDFYGQRDRIAMPLLVELYHVSARTLVDRKKTFVWDLRQAGLTDTQASGEKEKLAVQLSTRGVDALEPWLRALLPQPDVSTFNANLTSLFTQPHQEYTTETNYFAFGTKTCLRMKSVASLFKDTLEYQELLVTAGVEYAAYLAAKAGGVIPTAPFCVKRPNFVNPKYWEVCVGRLDGDLTRAALTGGVTAIDLGVGVDGLTALVDLGGINQKVDVTLRDVFIRWRGNPACLLRATLRRTLDDSTITDDPARNAWATCSDTNARAKRAQTPDPIDLPFSANLDPELFDVNDGGVATFAVPAGARRPESAVGTCGQPFVNSSVESLLNRYYAPLESSLGITWLDQSPASDFALAVDSLLAPFEHGTYDSPLDHTITTEQTRSGTTLLGNGNPVDGAWFAMRTDAELKPPFAVAPAQATFVRPPAVDVLWSVDGFSPHDRPRAFDVLFSTTTGALNQVLRERMGTERMHFTITPAPGDPTLGQILAAADPVALAPLTSPTVEWRVSPMIAPFTWMPRDPSTRQAPIVYHLNDLHVDAVEPGTGGDPDTLLLRMNLDFLDPDFTLALTGTLGSTYLTPALSSRAVFAVTVSENNLPACPMQVHIDKFVTNPCEPDLERLAADNLRETVENMLTDLLSSYPAPQFFDAQGKLLAPFQLEQEGVFKLDNRITFYGNVATP
ncbi:MAG: hypothetical protein HY899_05040 [Deltaproteobacteria bacterium]|nr:hypothetical protein [Deltaproteobacteria bacterium]